MKITGAFALAAAVMLAACDLSTGPDAGGTFNGSVSGEITANLQGSAIFGTLVDGQFSLVMEDPIGPHVIVIEHGQGRPGAGTHSIVHFDAETGLTAAYARGGEEHVVFLAEGGQIQITSSSSSRLEGTMSFEGVAVDNDEPNSQLRVTLTANFDARCVRTGGTDCR